MAIKRVDKVCRRQLGVFVADMATVECCPSIWLYHNVCVCVHDVCCMQTSAATAHLSLRALPVADEKHRPGT